MNGDVGYKTVYDRALRLLARRDHSKSELRIKLEAKNYDIRIINDVLDQLEKKDYLNDKSFADKYLKYRSGLGFGPKKIFHEMQKKGIDNQHIKESFDGFDLCWTELTRKAFQKKFGRIQNDGKCYRDYEKKIRFLVHRGFAYSDIKSVLGEHP